MRRVRLQLDESLAAGEAKTLAVGAGTAVEPAHVEGPVCESTDALGEHVLPALRRGGYWTEVYTAHFARFGRGIARHFFVPYNEKLYATNLDTLDVDAMGRFFPHADIADIIAMIERSKSGATLLS